MEYDPHDIQVLRLLKSFFDIRQAEVRETVVRMAESLASSDSAKECSQGRFVNQNRPEPDTN
jgi:hypothetical protein